MGKSVYDNLMDSLSEYDGVLPQRFSTGSLLELWKDVTEVDGELYSLSIEYVYPKVKPEDVIGMLRLVSVGRKNEALSEEKRIFSDGKLLSLENENRLLKFFGRNKDEICQKEMLSFLKERLMKTVYPEEVEILLMWCMYLDSYDDELQKIIMNFALDTEFSDQCYASIRKFPNGNEDLFSLIQRKSLYDRNTAIRIIHVDDSIKHWLLYHSKLEIGSDQDSEYASLLADKCDFISMLKDPDLSIDDFDKIREFTRKILWDDPDTRILKLSDLKEICILIAKKVRENPSGNGIEDLDEIRESLTRINQDDSKRYPVEDVLKLYDQALQDKKVISCAREVVGKGENLKLSILFDIPYDEKTALKRLKEDFRHYYGNVSFLTDPSFVKEAVIEMSQNIRLIPKDSYNMDVEKTSCADQHLKAYLKYHLDDDPDQQFQKTCENVFMKYSSINALSEICHLQKPFSYWADNFRKMYHLTPESHT